MFFRSAIYVAAGNALLLLVGLAIVGPVPALLGALLIYDSLLLIAFGSLSRSGR